MTRCAKELASAGVRLRPMLQDEGRFGRISSPRRCWAPRRMRPSVPNHIVREYTCAYVAVRPHDGAMDALIMPEVSGQAMSIFLRQVSDRHPDEFILMVMDGAGRHKANALKVPESMALILLLHGSKPQTKFSKMPGDFVNELMTHDTSIKRYTVSL